MPLTRCRNFNEDGSRKSRPNGYESTCQPDCQFVHPSDPAWDRARPSGHRGRGGHPYAPRGRSQSSFGTPGSGANSQPLSSNRGAWDDYISGSSSNPTATSSGWGASSSWDDPAKGGTSGWGDSATGDSGNPAATSSGWGASSSWDNQAKGGTNGWGDSTTGDSDLGSNVNNDVAVPERKSPEPAASDAKSSASQWGGHGANWGAPGEGWGRSDGTGWGSVDAGLGSGWGQDPTSNQWGNTLSEAATSNVGNSTVTDVVTGKIGDGSDAAKTADLLPLAIPLDLISSRHDQDHAHQPGRDVTTPASDPSTSERKISSPTTLIGQPPVPNATNKSQARTYSCQVTLESLSTDSEMSQLALCIAAVLKMRKLDDELAHWSALRKSPRLVMPRVDKDLLQTKYQEFKDTQLATKSAVESRTAQLGLPNTLFSITRSQDTERLHQLEAWVSRAEGCLSDLPLEDDHALRVKKEDALTDKLTRLKERSDSLAGTRWQCQDPQFYDTLLDHQLQDKKDLIISTIAKGQETAYNHLLSTSLSTVQQQSEVWNQRLQLHAGDLAQVLLQSNDLEKDEKIRSVLKAKEREIIEKLQTSIAQKKSQIQKVQKEMTQLQHSLTLIQSHTTSDLLGVYAPHIQRYIQSYIQGDTLPDLKEVFSKVAEEKVGKVWETLQPLTKLSIWLQHSITTHNSEEVEMKEIENSLLG
ncbi:hypothetical protein EDB83DRAFT_2671851 [Lactarius deliciosus]|nr:hypothetical protein EDB83DRAFT_2671851 [Lactarius deliciosus]